MEKILNSTKKLFVVIDKINQEPVIFDIALNDSDFIRKNLNMLMSMFQMKDIECYCLGELVDVTTSMLNSLSHHVDFTQYHFDTEAENLQKAGMKQEEIERYFAERAMNNKGITQKQIISIMENFIANNKEKIVEKE